MAIPRCRGPRKCSLSWVGICLVKMSGSFTLTEKGRVDFGRKQQPQKITLTFHITGSLATELANLSAMGEESPMSWGHEATFRI